MPVISYKTQLAKQIYITFFFLGGGAEQEYTHILFRTFKMNPAATATVTLKYGQGYSSAIQVRPSCKV